MTLPPESVTPGPSQVAFRLIAGEARPGIEVIHTDGVQKWIA